METGSMNTADLIRCSERPLTLRWNIHGGLYLHLFQDNKNLGYFRAGGIYLQDASPTYFQSISDVLRSIKDIGVTIIIPPDVIPYCR